MQKSDQEKYLSNISIISRLDGVLNSKEEDVIEKIRSEIGATKSILNQAIKNAQGENEIIPFQRFSDNIRNLEDMILVALADGELSENEKRSIAIFAKKIHLTQEQISIILQETKKRCQTLSEEMKCQQCNQTISSSSKFCPSCGASLLGSPAKQNETKLALEIPSWGLTVEFCESSSATFEDALRVAKLCPTFQECLRSKKKWYCATYSDEKILDLLKLVENLKGMRNRRIYVKGESVQWDEVFGFLWCFQRRQQAYKPEEYCFGLDEKRLNIWSCKQANMDWTEWADWFSYGKFKNENCFVFDKKRIMHELKTNLYQIKFCPCFRGKFVEVVMSLFPEEAKISSNTLWDYKEDYQQTPGAMKLVKKDDYYTEEVYVNGVKPVGFDLAKKLIEKGIKSCGIKQLDYRALEE